MAMTNIKLDRHFFFLAITQKLFARFYSILYPIFVMKFFISHYFFPLIPTVSYSAFPTLYVSRVTPLSPRVHCNEAIVWNHFYILASVVLLSGYIIWKKSFLAKSDLLGNGNKTWSPAGILTPLLPRIQ